jgi:hypothetical protein
VVANSLAEASTSRWSLRSHVIAVVHRLDTLLTSQWQEWVRIGRTGDSGPRQVRKTTQATVMPV